MVIDAPAYSHRFKQNAYLYKGIYTKRGNLPLIITAPHGGLNKPSWIQDRTKEGSLVLADMYTNEIASSIHEYITHYYSNSTPYMVSSTIHRCKADFNRSMEEGTESAAGQDVWKEYHYRVKESVENVLKEHRYGLLVDIHGHTHSSNRIELGYLLQPDELTSPSHALDIAVVEKSSIKALSRRSLDTIAPSLLLRTLGDNITDSSKQHIPVVPSTRIPGPAEESKTDYFSGGYTTEFYRDYSSGLDVVQIEIPRHLRMEPFKRALLVKSLSCALIRLIDTHYLNHSKL